MMRDGISPEYFAIGVILIIIFYLYTLSQNKKHIDQGRGDETDTHDYWGKPISHEENYKGGLISFIIFILVLLYIILTK